MNKLARRILFCLFFVSGFSSLVYQVVWTRMAFASFGIITPVLSVVLSVFMLGLSVGSWAGGRWIAPMANRAGLSAAFFYAGVEFMVGLGAFAVPKLFAIGERLLLTSGETDSLSYLLLSALVLAGSILPWCVCMGATFPFMMAYIREEEPANRESFSYLYLANVLGAMSGTFLTALLWVELLGFHRTLWLAAAGNFTVAAVSCGLGWRQRRAAAVSSPLEGLTEHEPSRGAEITNGGGMTRMILFSTGFVAMAMEVVWTRAFTPVLKTQVYSFAMIIFTYLGATFLGSWVYRHDLRRNRITSVRGLISALCVTALLPAVANDLRVLEANYRSPSIDLISAFILLASICPFCSLLGYLTPCLIDDYAKGQPTNAGKAYAINVLGCILGPLFAGYILLPLLSERHALILLSLPFLAFWFVLCKSQAPLPRWATAVAAGFVLVWCCFFTRDFERALARTTKNMTVRRDYAASVISFDRPESKALLVNGIGMTRLTPITKFMSHLALAFHNGRPQSALVICFGMGTSYRSAMSWDIDTTAVELAPGVVKAFGFYHADAAAFANNPKGHIIIDDGRRYLKRTAKKFDAIIIDPPPPVEAAGSSLLYSRDFYEIARQHLNPGGILQMWFPDEQSPTRQAVLRSIRESFAHVRCFVSVEGWGVHVLASAEPIQSLDATQFVARMPEKARKDLLEWKPPPDVCGYVGQVLSRERSIDSLLNADKEIQITDDRPFNEYYLLRQMANGAHPDRGLGK